MFDRVIVSLDKSDGEYSGCVVDTVSKLVSIKRGGLFLARNVFGFSNFQL